ncbi:Formate dehydrogenase, alpha subunit [Nitrolancea hollandica Lb]|uniref:Formate dehydrogenase, alpha subunit n=1 Tax=Nitrolancea hollandica Lb TaxID=1129897 RepID=I4EFE5_9BACT|nr:Formate dehydrogenase, alpha subunit [Nitrolancea hollandica Lb]
MPGLGARLGRGGATTFQESLADSDCIVIMGANMAENHPVGFRFVMKAKEQGAKLIHIDPRFSRTSAMADLHVALRPGSDIAFLGGLINYVINSERWNSDPFFKEYVTHYTNAPVIINPAFQDTEDLAGLFSGYNPDDRRYSFDSWQYAEQETKPAPPRQPGQTAEPKVEFVGRLTQPPPLDPTLQDPRCVFQIVKRHFARYTPEMVENICGVPQDHFLKVAEAILANSGRERTTSFAYAVAWTQHTVGTQMIGCCALLQLLLGNIGRPGGGILALRGHATIQGSTDIPTLFNLLPGYLPMPFSSGDNLDTSLEEYLRHYRPETGWWYFMPRYLVSLLKAWYGDAATPENDFAYDLVPKVGGDYSFENMVPLMKDGIIKGLICMGQNPAVGGQNADLAREALGTLDWLVVRDIHEIETAAFWYDAPEVRRGEVHPRDIKTEIFFLPSALTPEKDGSYTNTQRLVQWHDKAVEPPGDSRSETWFLHYLAMRLKELYAGDTSAKGRQIAALTWDYPLKGLHQEPDLDAVVKEINGFTVADGKPIPDFNAIADDGTTACGCWIYSGIMPEEGANQAKNRRGDARASLDWGFAWPANRRILYNRASADPQGNPWSERKKWIWWDAERGEWTGYDVPDFPKRKPPSYQPPPDATGIDAHAGDKPFIMMADGRGWLFAASGLRDGPLPTHYEPWETPVGNLLYPDHPRNPAAYIFQRPDNQYHEIGDPRFPYVITTYRLTEHHTAGGMSRFVPWLAELQPHGFIEISPELAAELGIKNRDWVTVSTLRGEAETLALVTERVQPLTIDGKTVHTVGMPWHFGYQGLATGGIANNLSALIEDPNSLIHEGKAFTCNLRKGRIDEGGKRHDE